MEGGLQEVVNFSPILSWENQTDSDKVILSCKMISNSELSEGLDVVVLHGLLSNGIVFKPFAEGLLEANNKVRRVLLVDLRNHGLSDHCESMKYIEMANDVNRLLVKLGVNEYLLFSHSMGSKTAMVMSMQKENLGKIKGLVILDTYPMDYQEFPQIYKNTLILLEFLLVIDLKNFTNKRAVIDYISQNFDNIPYFILTMYQNLEVNKITNQLSWKVNLKALKDNLMSIIGFELPSTTDISFYLGPLLILLGDKSISPLIPFDINSFTKIFPNFNKELDLFVVPGATHWIHIDALGQLLKFVSLFINKI